MYSLAHLHDVVVVSILLIQSSEDSVVVPLAIDILQSVTSYNCSITWDHMLQTTDSNSEVIPIQSNIEGKIKWKYEY